MPELTNAQNFCLEVEFLAKKYNLPCFTVTNGASLYHNDGCSAVKNARIAHIEWEIKNKIDPNHNWRE